MSSSHVITIRPLPCTVPPIASSSPSRSDRGEPRGWHTAFPVAGRAPLPRDADHRREVLRRARRACRSGGRRRRGGASRPPSSCGRRCLHSSRGVQLEAWYNDRGQVSRAARRARRARRDRQRRDADRGGGDPGRPRAQRPLLGCVHRRRHAAQIAARSLRLQLPRELRAGDRRDGRCADRPGLPRAGGDRLLHAARRLRRCRIRGRRRGTEVPWSRYAR
ncbi:MAG: hypothetical protein FJ293_12260 [Planctomycetes bacterium]|nr:hypothetical protein [Planctomycetota bacterium]